MGQRDGPIVDAAASRGEDCCWRGRDLPVFRLLAAFFAAAKIEIAAYWFCCKNEYSAAYIHFGPMPHAASRFLFFFSKRHDTPNMFLLVCPLAAGSYD